MLSGGGRRKRRKSSFPLLKKRWAADILYGPEWRALLGLDSGRHHLISHWQRLPCCRIITSFMKPLEGTDSSDCFSNVHLCGQLGSGEWRLLRVVVWNSQQESGISLSVRSTSLVSRLSFTLESNPLFFFPPLPFSLLFFPLVPSDLQTDCMTERVPQGGELPLIQIFCKWFVLVFVSLLAPNWTLLPLTKAAIIPPILFYVSRLSLPAGGSVRNRQPLGYNASSLMLPGRPSKTRINFRPLSFTSLSELKVVRWAKWTNKYCEDYNELYSRPAT